MLDYAGLDALGAVFQEGSFDRAARRLHVTPSAVSQRILKLEERFGRVLVIRGQPCRPTEAGLKLWRHLDEVRALEAALAGDLPGLAADQGPVVLRLAANADSLATWLLPALARFHAETGGLVDLTVDDQEVTAEALRSGAVVAAITAEAAPVQGCDVRPLGSLIYRATCSPAFRARHFPDGAHAAALALAPVLTFSRKDDLQSRWLHSAGAGAVSPPSHFLPSSEGFVTAARLGLGWGMNPMQLADPEIERGTLVEIIDGLTLATPLFLQSLRRGGPAVEALTRSLITEARASLRQAGAEA